MRYKYPDYYKEFKCTADKCEATCCAGWEIVIDEESIEKYVGVKTPFGNYLCNHIDFAEEVFHQDERKRCAFLAEDNLCDIYKELGEDYLCYTCKQYPRHLEEFEEMNEISLSISCPEVARMILTSEDKVSFYEEEIDELEEVYEDFDILFYETLYQVRELLFTIIQKRELEIDIRMQLSTSLIKETQERITGFDIFSIDGILEEYKMILAGSKPISKIVKRENSRQELMRSYMTDLMELESLQEEWQPAIERMKMKIESMDETEYQSKFQEFVDIWDVNGKKLELKLEQLLVYFIYSYFCGAVYDGEAKCKYEFARLSTLFIQELWFMKWIESGTIPTEEEIQRLTYSYARELEHSDINLELIESLLKKY